MLSIVIYGVGSPVIADVEESAWRAGLTIAAGVKNHPAASWLSSSTPVHAPDQIPADIVALPFMVPIFTPAYRQSALREALALGFTRPHTLVDPSVAMPKRFELGPGTYINVGVTLGSGVAFDEFAFVNRGASIGHHARFGPFVSIGPGAVLAGQVTVGRGAVVGAGAVVLPNLTIGSNAVVAAGAVVTRDVPDGCLVLGNPATVAEQGIGGHKGVAVT